MSVSNGNLADQTTFNGAFVSKTADSEVSANIDLNDVDVSQGTQVTQLQRELNSLNSFLGKTPNTAKDALPSWLNNGVGSPTDDVRDRADNLTLQVTTNTSDIATLQALDTFIYAGSWNASTNTPTLADGDGGNGFGVGAVYRVSVAGSQDLGSGSITFVIGDKVVYNTLGLWEKWDVSDEVTSVNGESGAVVLDLDDINDVDTTGVSGRDFLRRNTGNTAWEDFNIDSSANDAATGSNQTLTSVSTSIVRLTSGTLVSVDMIPAGFSGQKFVLINATGASVIINNETGATAANRILTGTGANLTLASDANLWLTYDTTTSRWRVVGGSGGSAGANTTLSNLVSPTAINQDLIFDKTSPIVQSENQISTNNSEEILFTSGTTVDGNSGNAVLEAGVPSGTGNRGFARVRGMSAFLQGDDEAVIEGPNRVAISTDGNLDLYPYSSTDTPILKLWELNGGFGVSIKASDSLAADYTLTLPLNDGSSGQVLSTDGSGVLSWIAPHTWEKQTFTLSAGDITNGYIDLANVALNDSIDFVFNGLVSRESADYTVNYTGGGGGNTRITFSGHTPALIAGDIVVVKYQY